MNGFTPRRVAATTAARLAALAAATIVGSLLIAPAAAAADGQLTVGGPAQTVYSHDQQACDNADYPDLPARALRTSGNQVVLYYGSSDGARAFVGPDLDHLTHRCAPIYQSRYDSDPSHFGMREWLGGAYTENGSTIYALVHEEYHGEGSGLCSLVPGTNAGDWANCWAPSIVPATSTDSGASFHDTPGQPVATIPYTFAQFRASSLFPGPIGYSDPSNIVKKDGYYYAFVQTFKLPQRVGSCLMRTRDLSDPTGWRGWDGQGFNVQFLDPYASAIGDPAAHICQAIAFPQIERMHSSLTYNTALHRYVLVGAAASGSDGAAAPGIYYSLSDDLINWTPRQLLLANPLLWNLSCDGSDAYFYPSLLDPSSPTRNFETTGAHSYLYLTRFHPKLVNGNCNLTLNRDLIRIPITATAATQQFVLAGASADTTPPRLIGVPADRTVEATGRPGTVVTYDLPVADDAVDGTVRVACSPASGTAFATGTTSVSCRAADSHGNAAVASFKVTVADRVPPALTGVPEAITVEATGRAGAVVRWPAPSATDAADGQRPVSCTRTSGSTFALGTTTVTCAAVDTSGNSARQTFSVRVVDTTAPALTVPATITVEATGPAGAAVSSSITAVDTVDGPVTPACVPASGAVLAANAPGLFTTVSCTATDSSRNASKKTFNVHVKGAAEQLGDLAALITAVGPRNSLTTNLVSGVTAAAKLAGRPQSCDNLAAARTLAVQKKGQLGTAAQSAQILASMNRIGAVLACR